MRRGDSAKALLFFFLSLCQNNNGIPPACGGGFPFQRGTLSFLTLSGVPKQQQQQLLCSLQRQGRIQMRTAKGSRDPPAAAVEKANGAAASTDANVAQPSRARCHQKARERAPCRIAFSIHVHACSQPFSSLVHVMEEEGQLPPKQALFYGAGARIKLVAQRRRLARPVDFAGRSRCPTDSSCRRAPMFSISFRSRSRARRGV